MEFPNFFCPLKVRKLQKQINSFSYSQKNYQNICLISAGFYGAEFGKYFVCFLEDKRSSLSTSEIFRPLIIVKKGNISVYSLKLWLMKLLWLSMTLIAPHYLYVELSALNVVGRDFTEFTEMLIYCQQMDQNTHKS